jgi:hypothetical protein
MKPKLFVFLTRNLFPVNGGDKKRVESVIEIAQKKYDINAIIISYKKINEIEYKKRDIRLYFFKLNLLDFCYSFLDSILKEKPLQCSLFYSKKIFNEIKKKFNKEKNSLCYFHLIRTADYIYSIPTNKNYLDCTDSLMLNYKKIHDDKKIFLFLKKFYFRERKLIKKYFKKKINSFTKIFYINKIDAIFDKRELKIKKKILIFNYNKHSFNFRNLYSSNSNNLILIARFTSFANLITTIQNINLIKKYNKIYNEKLNLYLCGYQDIKLKILLLFVGGNCVKIIYGFKDLFKRNIKFRFGLANYRISTGFQNKYIDYKMLNLPVILSNNVKKSINKKFLHNFKVMKIQNSITELYSIIHSKFLNKKNKIIISKNNYNNVFK